MNMRNIVLDTNSLIIAISAKNDCHKVWQSFLNGDYTLCISNEIVEEVGLSGEEVKWQKVNQYTFDKYIRLVDFVFDLLENGFAKIRIFFRNNQFIPTGLTKEQKRNEFSLLYYQFIKHSFGLQYSNPTKRPVKLKLFIDDIPLKGEDKRIFESFLYKLNTDDVFNKGNIILAKGDIREVDSKKHLPLQLMDLILGAICFRLNDKHPQIRN